MLRTRFDMSRTAGRLVVQVAVSVAATLIGSVLFAALPRLPTVAERTAVELTSGGKYAARIPGAASEAADDALAAPAPTPALSDRTATVFSAAPAAGTGSRIVEAIAAVGWSWTDASAAPAGDKPARSRPRTVRTGTVRHVADVLRSAPPARPAGPAGDPSGSDEGMFPKVVSTARSLWSFSASAGGALLSHLTP